MKKYLVVAIIILLAVIGAMWQQVKLVNKKWETAEANVKAYSMSLGKESEKNAALQLTAGQLGYFKDSVLQELDETRKQMKIKDKSLKALQQVSSSFTRNDTVYVPETIFRKPVAIDTLIGDKWYNMRLGLHYPSMIAVQPHFRSEKHIVVSSRRETVNPPKRCFILRWFQKRHTVVHVDVVEKNPYVEGESSKYVEVIR